MIKYIYLNVHLVVGSYTCPTFKLVYDYRDSTYCWRYFFRLHKK